MAVFISWLVANWPDLITAAGVMGTLWLGIRTANRESLERTAERHANLWMQMTQQQSLHRILKKDADLSAKPVTVEEEEFINLVILLFLTGWRNARTGGLISLSELSNDVGGFLSLPLPRAVWENTKGSRNPRFVEFIERALDRYGRLTATGA
jgi:hypothetical protein